jgi:membrane dipeptidase
MGALSLLAQGPGGSPQAKAAAKEYADLATRRFRRHIEGARKAILEELKPTPAQLERGLELHRESMVCDLYGGSNPVHVTGFYSESMKAWALEVLDREPDPERKQKLFRSTVRPQIQKWRALEVVHDPGFRANHRLAWESAQIDLGLADVAWAPEGEGDRGSLEYLASEAYAFDHLDYLEKFLRIKDLQEFKRAGKHAIIWHVGRPDACFAGPHIKDPIRSLDLYYGFGVRHCQLTNSTRNQVGTSHYQEVDTGLTEMGEAVIRRMNQLGIMVDLSHSGTRTTLDAIRASQEPVLISHTACRALSRGGKSPNRNATDEAIRNVADKGGMIGIITVPNLLGGFGAETVYRHLDHAVKLVGVDHIGLASDQGPMGRAVQAPEIVKILKPRKFLATGFKGTRAYWEWETGPRPLSWVNAPYLTVGLVVRGYSDDDIRKIIGGNFLRVAGTILDKQPRGRLT